MSSNSHNPLLNPLTYNQNFDIGGPDILTYKEMLLGFAKLKLKKMDLQCL
jgi:hypothetical protein